VPPDQNIGKLTTTTNGAGQYRFGGLTEATIFDFEKGGYDGVSAGAYSTSMAIDVVLDRTLTLDAGGSLTATIWGDDDFWDEELMNTCHTPQVCRFVHFAPATSKVTVFLRPINPAFRLGLFIHQFGPGYRSFPATEVAGSGGVLTASAALTRGPAGIIVQLFGAGPNDHQDFELTTEYRPH